MKRRLAPIASLATFVGGWYLLAYSLDKNFATDDGSALIIRHRIDCLRVSTSGRLNESSRQPASPWPRRSSAWLSHLYWDGESVS